MSDSLWPCIVACEAPLSFTISQSLLNLMSIESVMPSNHLILCLPLLLLPSIFPSIRVFSNESALRIRWPKYWSFTFSISPSNKYSGLISFRMDWLDILAAQGTLSRAFSNTTIWKHQFFSVQSSLWSNSHIPIWLLEKPEFSSVQFSRSVMSDSLQPHELQHARPPCPSPTPGVYSNSCPSSRWCHPTIVK